MGRPGSRGRGDVARGTPTCNMLSSLSSLALLLLWSHVADGDCVAGDCTNGRGVFVDGGRKYDGEWKDGVQHGRGVFHFSAAERYDGEWRNGKPNGHGVKVYADGRRYDGEWRDNKKHGRGVLTWADGASYDGDWVADAYEVRFHIHFQTQS